MRAARLLFGLLFSAPAFAYVSVGSEWADTDLPVHVQVNPAGSGLLGACAGQPGFTNATCTVAAAFATWQSASCSHFAVAKLTETTSSEAKDDNVNTIHWVASNWQYGDLTIGITFSIGPSDGHNHFVGPFTDADIQFNAVNNVWTLDGNAVSGDSRTPVDAQSIATHEAGHFLGLGHTSDTSAIMFASYDGPKRALAQDDLDGVCAIYPKPTPNVGKQGEPCIASDGNGDCSPGLVCGGLSRTPHVCTVDCSSGAPCPVGTTCGATGEATPLPVKACLPPPAPPDDCKDCSAHGGSDCQSGVCVYVVPSGGAKQYICTRNCNPNVPSSCAPGYSCSTGASGQSVCIPSSGSCSALPPPGGLAQGATCNSPTACTAGLDCISFGAGFTCRASVGACGGCAESDNAYCQGSLVCAGDASGGRCRASCDPVHPETCATGVCVGFNDGSGQGVCTCTDETAQEGQDCRNVLCGPKLSCITERGAQICRTACDAGGNCALGRVCASGFCVSGAAPATDGGTTGTTTGGTTGGSTGSGGDTPPPPPGPGCGCHGSNPSALWPLALLLLWRRRASSSPAMTA